MSVSGQSSSGSWSGRGAGADIIDLDKFMRGAVRPSEPPSHPHPHHHRRQEHFNGLVVDGGGGAAHKLLRHSSSTSCSTNCSASGAASGAVSKCAVQAHAKRFSHDSGLSDGTCNRRRHRPHRRPSGAEGVGVRSREPASSRALQPLHVRGAGTSSSSLRAFRTLCERALRDQQQQIAHVAQLCERLTEGQADRAPDRAPDRSPDRKPERTKQPRPDPSLSPDSSDSSSSRSTDAQRRKDKHRAQECKTYKIIMNKLDELNRLFAARAKQSARLPIVPAVPPVVPSPLAPAHPARRPPQPSSDSVSVSDKLVATEDTFKRKPIIPKHQVAEGATQAGSRSVTQSFVLDIPPTEARHLLVQQHRPNVLTQSIIKCESSYEASESSKCDPRCGFDLENPLHLYSQAKQLHAHATVRRAHRVERDANIVERPERPEGGEPSERHERVQVSLCALCRGYWRSLWQFLLTQTTATASASASAPRPDPT